MVGGHDIFYMLSASHACMMLLPQQQVSWDLTLSLLYLILPLVIRHLRAIDFCSVTTASGNAAFLQVADLLIKAPFYFIISA